jgi:hypothetical protein
MKKIEITADWVLNRLTEGLYADGYGNIVIQNLDTMAFFFIELTLNQLNVPFTFECYDEETEFYFKLDDLKKIQRDCPEFYKEVSEMNYNNSLSGIRNSKINYILNT